MRPTVSEDAPTRLVLASENASSALAIELDELVASTKAFAARARADSTRKRYRGSWKQFAKWCAERALLALPAVPETVCLYLTACARKGRKVATLSLARTAIRVAHRRANLPDPCAEELVRETWKGICRELGMAQVQKHPLSADHLRAMVQMLPAGLAGSRDRALLLLGFAGGFRRSELVALERRDLHFAREGLECTVRRSKTDQVGRGALKVVAYAGDPDVCPVRAMQDWLGRAEIVEGAVFRRIRKNGQLGGHALTDQVVATLVKRGVAAIGLRMADYAGHSLRAGFVTAAKANGADDAAIMDQTGHRSLAMVQRYHRRTRAWERPASARLGL